jgi:hypothetical protein
VRGARVRFAGRRGRTAENGVARISASLALPGRFAALADKGSRYGLSRLVAVGNAPTAVRAARDGGS